MDSPSTPAGFLQRPNGLIGRERDVASLRSAMERASAGHGGLVLVSGEAGVGKTALVQRLRDEVAGRYVILEGHCYDLTVTPPYGPWAEALRGYIRSDALPGLPKEIRPAPLFASASSQPALFEAIATFFTAVAETKPLVVILEDLHWADPASVELLRHVAQRSALSRLLVIATYRDTDLLPDTPIYQHRVALVRESDATRIELRRLDPATLADLILARYTLDDESAGRMLPWIARLSEGNPLYAVEILRALEASHILFNERGIWRVGDLAGFEMPTLVRQVVGGHIDQLSDRARQHFQIAALIGEAVEFDLWSAVCGRTLDELVEDYEEAQRHALIVEAPDGRHFRFTHALVRQTLHDDVSALRRRALHRSIADAILAAPSPDPDVLAYHLGEARDPRHLIWLIRAGDRAQRTFAWRSALDRFRAALELASVGSSGSAQRGWLLFRAGAVLRISDASTALAYFDEALATGTRVADPVLVAYATYAIGLVRSQRGDAQAGILLLERGIEALRVMPVVDRIRLNSTQGVFDPAAIPNPEPAELAADPAEAAEPPELLVGDIDRLGVLALLVATTGDARRAVAIIDGVLARQPGIVTSTHRFAGHFFRAQGCALALLGQPVESLAAFRRSSAAFEAGVHYLQWLQSVVATLDSVVWHCFLDDLPLRDTLMAEARRAGELSTDVFPHGLSYRHLLLDELLLRGNWRELADLIGDADMRSAPVASAHSIHRVAATLARCQGRTDDALHHIYAVLPDGLNTAPGSCVYLDGVNLAILATHIAMDAGDLGSAVSWLDCVERWVKWSGATLLENDARLARARLHVLSSDSSAALSIVEDVLAATRLLTLPMARWEALMLRGQILSQLRRYLETEQSFDAAHELAARCDLPFQTALTAIALAELGIATGALSDARATLRHARRFCEHAAALPALERIAAIDKVLASRSGRVVFPAGLSAREVEVLRLVADGLSDAEVAAELSISPRTVGQHLRSIYNKLGVSSRVGASRFAVEQGLV